MKVTVKVEPHKDGWGYQLRHNQKAGFKGYNTTFSWYRRKKDAIERAKELEKCFN